METYNLSDAEKLVAYYRKKLIGLPIEHASGNTVADLRVEDYGDEQYRVNAHGGTALAPMQMKRPLDDLVRLHGLMVPEEVLRGEAAGK